MVGFCDHSESHNLVFYCLLYGFGGLGFGREFDHQLSTAVCDTLLVEGIESLLALFADAHQIRLAQNGEVMRDRGLGDVDLFNDVVD